MLLFFVGVERIENGGWETIETRGGRNTLKRETGLLTGRDFVKWKGNANSYIAHLHLNMLTTERKDWKKQKDEWAPFLY